MRMKHLLQYTLAVGLCTGVLAAHAMVSTTPAHVTKFHIYTDYGEGDVVFRVDATVAGCDGFWLPPTDPGFRQTYAALLLVKATGATLEVTADESRVWPGSSARYCRVDSLTSG